MQQSHANGQIQNDMVGAYPIVSPDTFPLDHYSQGGGVVAYNVSGAIGASMVFYLDDVSDYVDSGDTLTESLAVPISTLKSYAVAKSKLDTLTPLPANTTLAQFITAYNNLLTALKS